MASQGTGFLGQPQGGSQTSAPSLFSGDKPAFGQGFGQGFH